MKEENVTMDGEVVAVHRGSLRVVLANGGVVSATIAGRMMGDKVLVEMTPYDLNQGADRLPLAVVSPWQYQVEGKEK